MSCMNPELGLVRYPAKVGPYLGVSLEHVSAVQDKAAHFQS
jgi:hypothetical protein